VKRVLAFGLLLPLLAVPVLSRSYADRWGSRVSEQLSRAVAPMAGLALDAMSDAPQDEEAVLSESPGLRESVHAAQSEHLHAHSSHASVAHGIRISAAQVLSLAARRTMPQAVPVKATAYHPAGLLLRGVSGMGVGLQDGDVLTEAAGQKASSVGTVIGIVLAARARQTPEISGRFYRAGVPFLVTVEQPYPKAAVPG
jgi:hypothetical protein